MREVSDKLKTIYADENVPKYLTLSFPEDDIEDITNENIEADSMSLVQSICEESTPIWGGCCSSQFEITVMDMSQDLAGKKIKASMSVQDPNYKGEWTEFTNYIEDNIVKKDGKYYQCIEETSLEESDHKKTITDFQWDANNSIDQSNAETDKLWDSIRITTDLIGKEGVTIILRTWYTDSPYNYRINLSKEDTLINFNRIASFKDINYTLKGWTLQISNTSDDEIDLSGTTIEAVRGMYTNEVAPELADDIWLEQIGYVDTSNAEPLVLFTGNTEKPEVQSDHRYLKLSAYDKLYSLSEKDITEWYNNESRNNKYYQGTWAIGTKYTANQVIGYTSSYNTLTGLPEWHYYRCKKELSDVVVGLSPAAVAGGAYDSMYNITGSDWWEEITSNYYTTMTIKSLRDQLFSYLEIEQEDVALPCDDLLYVPALYSDSQLYALDLIKVICQINGCFGFLEPETEKFRYVIPDCEDMLDSNYMGAFEKETKYTASNVVLINDENTEYCDKYFMCLKTTSSMAPGGNTNEIVYTSWYSPSEGTYGMAAQANIKYIIFDFDKSLLGDACIRVYTAYGDKEWIVSEPGIVDISGYESMAIVIFVEDASKELWSTFTCTLGKLINRAYEYYPYEDEAADFWQECSAIYHPTGRINLSGLYEQEQADYGVYDFVNNGIKLVDSEGNVVKGKNTDKCMSIPFTYLLNPRNSGASDFRYEQLAENLKNTKLNFTPCTILTQGLPFMEVGDKICFNITEQVKDEGGELVDRTRLVKSIVLKRTISGINALSDNIESKYE